MTTFEEREIGRKKMLKELFELEFEIFKKPPESLEEAKKQLKTLKKIANQQEKLLLASYFN